MTHSSPPADRRLNAMKLERRERVEGAQRDSGRALPPEKERTMLSTHLLARARDQCRVMRE
jgi:hypothetical protein